MGLFGAISGAVGGFLHGGPIGAVEGAVQGFTGGGQDQTPFPQVPRPGSIDINPPFGGGPGVGINVQTKGGPLMIGAGQQAGGNLPARRHAGNVFRQGEHPVKTEFPPHGGGGGRGSLMKYAQYIGKPHKVAYIKRRICPPGMALAIDGNCYPRQWLPRTMRAVKPRRSGPIKRSEWKALMKAASAEKKAYRVAKKAGLSVKKPRKK